MGNNRVSSPLVAKADAYIGTPEDSDYTISSDIMGTKVGKDLPDMGLVAHRYRLVLWGNKQQLRLDHWDAMPRVAVGIPYKIEPDVWYRMKLKANPEGKKCRLYGKVWPRDQKEPAKWDIEFVDPNPDVNGAPGLYRYSTAVQPPRPGTAIFFDNVLITSNKK